MIVSKIYINSSLSGQHVFYYEIMEQVKIGQKENFLVI